MLRGASAAPVWAPPGQRHVRHASVCARMPPGCVMSGTMGSRCPALADNRLVERATGIEPAPSVWKTEALPLSYARTGGSHRVGAY